MPLHLLSRNYIAPSDLMFFISKPTIPALSSARCTKPGFPEDGKYSLPLQRAVRGQSRVRLRCCEVLDVGATLTRRAHVGGRSLFAKCCFAEGTSSAAVFSLR